MSNLYQDIETAIVAKFSADVWLGDTDNVKTVRTDVPETLLGVVEWTELFPDADLPAVAVLDLVENPTVVQDSVNELRYEVPVKVLGVVMERTKAAARNAVQELLGNVERALNACRTSAQALALTGTKGSFVKAVSSTADVQRNEGARRYYGLGETDAVVVIIKDL